LWLGANFSVGAKIRLKNSPQVSYDTVKTLRSVIENLVRTHKIGGKVFADTSAATFQMFTTFPRRLVDDDSMTLADLNFLPNGVIHVIH
jgi:hypothetical protein